MMRRRAIIHIGTLKTGSTSIQRLCASNRDVLLASGFAYSKAAGERSHRGLVAIAASPDVGDHFARLTGLGQDQTEAVETLRATLAAELEMLPDSVHTVIFSNEHCSQRIRTVEEATRLKHFMREFFSEIRILAYLRRQDEYMVSNYSTRLRHGNFTGIDVLPSIGGEGDGVLSRDASGEPAAARDLDRKEGRTADIDKPQLDWAAMLDVWRSAFGCDRVNARIFDKQIFVGGDLVIDFQHACGIPPVLPSEGPAANTSLVPEAQEFLRRLNVARREVSRKTVELPSIPRAVRRELNMQYSGRGRLPSRTQARAFFEHYRDANERLRVEYFPDRPAAFMEDFSRYPEMPDPIPGDAAVLRVALAMLVAVGSDLPAESALKSQEKLKENKRGHSKAQRNARREARVATRAARRAPSAAATFEPPTRGK